MPGPKTNIEKKSSTSSEELADENSSVEGQGCCKCQAGQPKGQGLLFKYAELREQQEPGRLVYRSLAEQDGWERIDPVYKPLDLRKYHGAKTTEYSRGAGGQPARPVALNSRLVKTLIFDFEDYAVAQYHGFTSCEVPELMNKIQQALEDLDVSFQPVQDSSSLFLCEAVEASYSAKFTLDLSELKPKCQAKVGNKYLLEVCRSRCAGPRMWASLCTSIFAKLEDVVKVGKNLQTGVSDSPYRSSLSYEASCRETPKNSVSLQDSKQLVDMFFDLVSSERLPDEAIGYAEALANLHESLKIKAESSEATKSNVLSMAEIERLHSMLCHNQFDVRRCTCTIIQSLGQHGLLRRLDAKQQEDLFKSLLRVVNMVSERCAFLGPMQREALRALKEMSVGFRPHGILADQAKQTFDRCATSENSQVSDWASRCLAQFFA